MSTLRDHVPGSSGTLYFQQEKARHGHPIPTVSRPEDPQTHPGGSLDRSFPQHHLRQNTGRNLPGAHRPSPSGGGPSAGTVALSNSGSTNALLPAKPNGALAGAMRPNLRVEETQPWSTLNACAKRWNLSIPLTATPGSAWAWRSNLNSAMPDFQTGITGAGKRRTTIPKPHKRSGRVFIPRAMSELVVCSMLPKKTDGHKMPFWRSDRSHR